MAFLEKVGKTIVGDVLSNYFFGGIAVVVTASLLSKTLKQTGRAYLVSATREVISFKQWLSSGLAENKEFCEDIIAEARHQYLAEVDKRLNILQKQQEFLQKIKATL